jgi:hypothetical protein
MNLLICDRDFAGRVLETDDNLKYVMNLLKDQHSVQIKTEAFHIFKVLLGYMI